MRKSIFDIEIRIDLKYEFEILKNILNERDTVFYNNFFHTLYDLLNDEIFPIWKYKGAFVDFDDFCYRLNIDWEHSYISHENFLNLLELLVNLWTLVDFQFTKEQQRSWSKKVIGYMQLNLPLIIEKMNYQIIEDKDKLRIVKRDSDVDSILDIAPSNCSNLLLDYNDIRNNTIESKRKILKDLDLYIEKNKRSFQSLNNDTYTSIQIIVNKMGVNHPIDEEPYSSFNEQELIDWYDKCFKLIIHLIRAKEVNEINKIRKKFSSN